MDPTNPVMYSSFVNDRVIGQTLDALQSAALARDLPTVLAYCINGGLGEIYAKEIGARLKRSTTQSFFAAARRIRFTAVNHHTGQQGPMTLATFIQHNMRPIAYLRAVFTPHAPDVSPSIDPDYLNRFRGLLRPVSAKKYRKNNGDQIIAPVLDLIDGLFRGADREVFGPWFIKWLATSIKWLGNRLVGVAPVLIGPNDFSLRAIIYHLLGGLIFGDAHSVAVTG
jgi:hypothetical protein